MGGRVNEVLKQEGLVTWFDEERMVGDIVKQMTEGIDRSRNVIVFITKTYVEKVNGEAERGLDDNCALEFGYACQRKGIRWLIATVMEPSCCDTRKWHGPVGMKLGGQLFHDLSD